MAHHLLTDPSAFDLDAYFARIGYDGAREPSLTVLRDLHLLHAQAIAFENLNPLLGWPVRLDSAALVNKLVREGRGGYCFEHNLLFAHALDALGFRFDGLAGRVMHGAPPDVIRPRTHVLLRVELEGDVWIADVGFGGLTMTAPLALRPGEEQRTPHEPMRLTAADGGYVVETLLRGAWTPLYRFTLEPAHLVDYEMASWYLCHHPESRFITGLTAARPQPGRRYALRDGALATYYVDGRVEQRVIRDGAELRDVLAGLFGLRLPDSPETDAALDRVTGMSRAAAI